MTGVLVERCAELGIRIALVVPGADVAHLVEDIRASGRIRAIMLPDEACAVAMADGYARRIGRPALVIAPGGPGAATLVAGAAQRAGSGVPMLLVTARAAEEQSDLGWNIDDAGLTAAAGCITLRVRHEQDLPSASRWVAAGLEGGQAVHLILDVGERRTHGTRLRAPVGVVRQSAPVAPPAQSVPFDDGRVVLLLGSHALPMADALRDLATGHELPVMTDMTARGAIPESSSRAVGHLGFAPAASALAVLGPDPDVRADLVVAVGCTHDLVTRLRRRSEGPAVAVVEGGDIPRWIDGNSGRTVTATVRAERTRWIERIRQRRDAPVSHTPARSAAIVDHLGLVRTVARAVGPGAVHVADAGGSHVAVVTGLAADRPRTVISTDTLTMMGWGLRAALGAAVADPEVPVIAYVGDGSLHVAGTALSVAAGLRLRVLVVVPENGVLGSARRRHRPGPHDPALLPPLDPVLLAMSCGVPALRCGTAGAVIDGVRGFVSGDGPTLLAVPMPAPGPDESGGPEAVLTGIPVLDGRRT